jgi:succinyl-CoA synthetase beta subunit
LKLYEYEAKSILAGYGVPTPKGELAETPLQARETARRLGDPVVVKAQVLVAGRGKAGGILFADSSKEAEEQAQKLLGAQIKGIPVTKILIEQKIPIKRELYFGITVDRLSRSFVIVACETGGVDIEELSEKEPQKIFKMNINPQSGFFSFHAVHIAQQLGYKGDQMMRLTSVFEKLYQVNVEQDAELVECNPLVETLNGDFVCADARLIVDDNSLFRHPDFKKRQLEQQRDLTSQEFEALKNGLDYVKLEGNIGVAGNGAGLVMATLDLINSYGGKPANFLDMGGGAPPERIEAALAIILTDPAVEVLFANILGGITLCDEVARGIILARKKLNTSKPLVVRLVGTNEEEGKRILTEASIPVFESMEEAAHKAVELGKKEI